jgi:hypothetical protein
VDLDVVTQLSNEISHFGSVAPAAMNAAGQRAEPSPDRGSLVKLAQKRAALMERLAQESPNEFLKHVVPQSVRTRLSTDVQAHVEQLSTVSGTLDVVHNDDFENHENSTFRYHVKTRGGNIDLYIAGTQLELSSGATVVVNGYALNNTLVAAGGAETVEVGTTPSPEATGEQKVLLIPVTSQSLDQNERKPMTKTQLESVIFSGPFEDYYKEQSYGKAWFVGTSTPWIIIPETRYPDHVCGGIGLDDPDIKRYLLNNHIDLGHYDRIVFVLAGMGGGCSVVGKSDYSFNGSTLHVSISWVGLNRWKEIYKRFVNGALKQTTSVVAAVAFMNCKIYSQNHPNQHVECEWSGERIYDSDDLSMQVAGMDYFSYVMAHELGHALGVMHSNALNCTGRGYYNKCSHVEYGNRADVMGTGLYGLTTAVPAMTIGGHFNAYDKDYLGWLEPKQVSTFTKSGEVSLTPLEEKWGKKLAILKNPGVPTKPLYVEYRQPIGFDSGLASPQGYFSSGLYINETDGSSYVPAARLLGANQPDETVFTKPALGSGSTFREVGRGLTISALTETPEEAIFDVTVGTPVCKRFPLTVSTSWHDEINVVYGTYVSLQLIIQNNDTPTCDASDLQVHTSISDIGDWNIEAYPSDGISSEPGSIQYVYLTLEAVDNVPVGLHTLTSVVKDTTHARIKKYTEDIRVVTPANIASITPLSGGSGTEVTLSGSGFGSSNTVYIRNSLDPSINLMIYKIQSGWTTTVSFTLPDVCPDYGTTCAPSSRVPLSDGTYLITIQNDDNYSISNQVVFIVGSDKLYVTSPNGGEEWEIGTLNSITWGPYSYNPDINPSSQIMAYLERKQKDGTYRTIGQILESGKASIHWYGDVGTYNTYPSPGKNYYVRIENTVSGETDRSDNAFSILARAVDLKVDGSDGPVTVADNDQVTLSWTTKDVSSCQLHGVRTTSGGTIQYGLQVATSSSNSVMYAAPSTGSVYIYCLGNNGDMVFDSVSMFNTATALTAQQFAAAPLVPMIRVTAPNGGESLAISTPHMVTWDQQGTTLASVALYKDDKWFKWLAKSVSRNSFVWTPGPEESAEISNGSSFKIYVTARKLDGTGYVNDKSDAAFQFVRSPLTFSYSPGNVLGLSTNIAAPFTRDLELGLSGDDVLQLQQFLNTRGFTVATTGPGSTGNESTYFGPQTQYALTRFQDAYRTQVLLPAALTSGTGYFGPLTRDVINGQIREDASVATQRVIPVSAGNTSPTLTLLQQIEVLLGRVTMLRAQLQAARGQ